MLDSVRRLPNGRAASAADMRKLASLGGKANRERTRLASRLGLGELGPLPKELADDADRFRRTECARLARLVGNGTCGAAPSSMVASAALQLAASRYAFAKGEFALASRLAVDSRQSLLAAHELTAREAAARRLANAPRWPFVRAAEPDDEPEQTEAADDPSDDEDAPRGQPGAGDDEPREPDDE